MFSVALGLQARGHRAVAGRRGRRPAATGLCRGRRRVAGQRRRCSELPVAAFFALASCVDAVMPEASICSGRSMPAKRSIFSASRTRSSAKASFMNADEVLRRIDGVAGEQEAHQVVLQIAGPLVAVLGVLARAP